MSWNIAFIGKTSDVVAALKAESNKLTFNDASKQEYDAALPHLVGLVEQNVEPQTEAIVKVQAAGHGTVVNGKIVQNQVSVGIERFYGSIV